MTEEKKAKTNENDMTTDEKKEIKKKPSKGITRTFKSKINVLIRKFYKSQLSDDYYKISIERVKYHSGNLKSQVDDVIDKLTNNDDKANFKKLSKWLNTIEISLSSLNKEAILQIIHSMKFSSSRKEMKYYSRGVRLTNSGKQIKAIKQFSKSIEIQPRFAKAFLYRAHIYNEIREFVNSINDCNQYLKLRPNYSKVYYLRGLDYFYLGKFESAKSDFDTAIEISKYYKEAFYFRGICKINLNDKVEGCKDIRIAKDLGHDVSDEFKEICEGK